MSVDIRVTVSTPFGSLTGCLSGLTADDLDALDRFAGALGGIAVVSAQPTEGDDE